MAETPAKRNRPTSLESVDEPNQTDDAIAADRAQNVGNTHSSTEPRTSPSNAPAPSPRLTAVALTQNALALLRRTPLPPPPTPYALLNVALISLCWCLGLAAFFIQVSTTNAAAASYASAREGTVPLGALLAVTTLAAPFLPSLVVRFGPRRAYLAAVLLAAVGAAVNVVAALQRSFALLVVGAVLQGVVYTCTNHLRFTVLRFVHPRSAAHAIAGVVAGGALSAALGPELALHTRDSLEQPFAGSYLVAVGLYVAYFLALLVIDFDYQPDFSPRAPTDAQAAAAAVLLVADQKRNSATQQQGSGDERLNGTAGETTSPALARSPRISAVASLNPSGLSSSSLSLRSAPVTPPNAPAPLSMLTPPPSPSLYAKANSHSQSPAPVAGAALPRSPSLSPMTSTPTLLVMDADGDGVGMREDAEPRSLCTIACNAEFRLAVLVAAVSYSAMGSLMAAAPVAMRNDGHSFQDQTLTVQLHILGMFLPSVLSGGMVSLFKPLPVTLLGLTIMVAGSLFFLLSDTISNYNLGIITVGVGWNFAFVASTKLMTLTCTVAERPRAVAANELIVLGALSILVFSSSYSLAEFGWHRFALLHAVFIFLAALVVKIYMWYRACHPTLASLTQQGLVSRAPSARVSEATSDAGSIAESRCGASASFPSAATATATATARERMRRQRSSSTPATLSLAPLTLARAEMSARGRRSQSPGAASARDGEGTVERSPLGRSSLGQVTSRTTFVLSLDGTSRWDSAV